MLKKSQSYTALTALLSKVALDVSHIQNTVEFFQFIQHCFCIIFYNLHTFCIKYIRGVARKSSRGMMNM